MSGAYRPFYGPTYNLPTYLFERSIFLEIYLTKLLCGNIMGRDIAIIFGIVGVVLRYFMGGSVLMA